MKALSALGAGSGSASVVGLGMANLKKVLGFLDVGGDWDASPMLVMAAVAVTAIAFDSFSGGETAAGRRIPAA